MRRIQIYSQIILLFLATTCFAEPYYIFINKKANNNVQEGEVEFVLPATKGNLPTRAEQDLYQIVKVDITRDEAIMLVEPKKEWVSRSDFAIVDKDDYTSFILKYDNGVDLRGYFETSKTTNFSDISQWVINFNYEELSEAEARTRKIDYKSFSRKTQLSEIDKSEFDSKVSTRRTITIR